MQLIAWTVTIVLTVLNITEVTALSWWAVFAPVLIVYGSMVAALGMVFLFFLAALALGSDFKVTRR